MLISERYRCMKTVVAFLSLCCFFETAFGQTDTRLSSQIDSLAEADQKWRLVLAEPERLHLDPSSVKTIQRKIGQTDSLNYISIQNIFRKYGFPGYKMVGRK